METISISPRLDVKVDNYKELMVTSSPVVYVDSVHETIFPQLNICCYLLLKELCKEYDGVLLLSSLISKLIKHRFHIVVSSNDGNDVVAIPEDFVILTCPEMTRTFRVMAIIDRTKCKEYHIHELNIDRDHPEKLISIGDEIINLPINDPVSLYKTRFITINSHNVTINATLLTLYELVSINSTSLHFLYGKK